MKFRKSNALVFLEKLIEDTKNGIVTWKNLNNVNSQYYIEFKGVKNITGGKYLEFKFRFLSDRSECEVCAFLANENLKTRDLIFTIKPSFFSFKQKNLLSILMDILSELIQKQEHKENKITTNIVSTKKEDVKSNLDLDDMGEVKPLKRVWDDDDDDEIKGAPI